LPAPPIKNQTNVLEGKEKGKRGKFYQQLNQKERGIGSTLTVERPVRKVIYEKKREEGRKKKEALHFSVRGGREEGRRNLFLLLKQVHRRVTRHFLVGGPKNGLKKKMMTRSRWREERGNRRTQSLRNPQGRPSGGKGRGGDLPCSPPEGGGEKKRGVNLPFKRRWGDKPAGKEKKGKRERGKAEQLNYLGEEEGGKRETCHYYSLKLKNDI